MSPSLLLFAGAVIGTVGVFYTILKPKVYRLVLIGAGFGMGSAAFIAYVNRSRHSVTASFVPITLKTASINFEEIRPVIYENFALDRMGSDLPDSNKEKSRIYSKDFGHPKVLDIDEVRRMWLSAVLPVFRSYGGKEKFAATESVEDIERGIVFCEIGSKFGDICLQLLAETKCTKTIGIEANSSLIQTSKEVAKRAQEYYPEVFNGKECIWIEDDFSNCTDILKKEAVNTIFTYERLIDKNLMEKLTSFARSVPSVKCIVTSQKIDDELLKSASFGLTFVFHSSSDWSKGSLLYVYQRQ
ncbi:unnamed protein product [Phytomonas sp. EM1]|nr:unnamed protein product [Phytomonas sp. EM1]|eukprot:CCW60856.1 unnamed protein product [Phytomonas sp. isolate EM1]